MTSTAHINRIADLADRLKNHNDQMAKYAALNLDNRQPAFWSIHGHNNQPASLFAQTVNARASILFASTELDGYFTMNGRDVYAATWLDGLLPLNAAAGLDLVAAYARGNRYVSMRELFDRTEVAEGFKVFA